jgi:oligopeptide transport system substrate-binding protein
LNKKLFWGILVIAIFGSLYFATHFSHSKKHLKSAFSSDIETLDPAKAFNDRTLNILTQVYEPLYQYQYLVIPYQLEPLLAESMPRYNSANNSWIIKIKENVFYQDHLLFGGKKREVVAEDFIFQIKRICFAPLSSPGFSFINNRIKGTQKFRVEAGDKIENLVKINLDGVKARSRYELEIFMEGNKKNIKNISALFTMNFFTPLPSEVVLELNNNLDQVTIGTGPYHLEKNKNNIVLKKNDSFRLEKFPNSGDRHAHENNMLSYSGQKLPFIESYNFEILTNEEELWGNFLKGKYHFIEVAKKRLATIYATNGDLNPELTKMNFSLQFFPEHSLRWIGFNMHNSIFSKDRNLRLAVAHAIDNEEYVAQLRSNADQVANSIFGPGILGFNPARPKKFIFDKDMAKNFLQKSHYRGETIKLSSRGDKPEDVVEINFIAEQLENIGLKIETEILSFNDFLNRGRLGELTLWVDQWIYDYPDPENLIALLYGKNFPGVNKSGINYPQLNLLYEKLKNFEEGSNRTQLSDVLTEVETLVENDVLWIPLSYGRSYYIKSDRVKNFRRSSFIRNYTKYLDFN